MNTTTYEYPIYRGPQLLERFAIVPVLALRVYLASVWLRFAMMKLQGGWLTTNPLRPVLSAVAAGQVPTTVHGYGFVARKPDELKQAISDALAVDGPAIVDAVVAANELPNVPHLDLELLGQVARAKIKEAVLAVTGG